MVLSFLKRWRNAATARAVAALIGAGAAAFTAPAMAQDNAADWYIFVGRNANDNPIVVYFQSDPSTAEFQPVGSVALVINPEYEAPPGEFDPLEACRYTSLDESSLEAARDLNVSLIYGPNSEQVIVSILDLPLYMAQQTVEALIEGGVVIDQIAAIPFFNCAGFVWVDITQQEPEFWEQIISEERTRIEAEQ